MCVASAWEVWLYQVESTNVPAIPQGWEPFGFYDGRRTIIALRKKIAAKTVDRLTGQADCEDPEKAALEERVRILEERLAFHA